MAETSSKRLQLQVDLVNIMTAAVRAPHPTWHVCQQMVERFPVAERDIVAYTLFHFIRTDPGSMNLDHLRQSYLPAADWGILQETVAATQAEPNTFAMLRKGIEAIEAHDRNDVRADFAGVMSMLLLVEVARRMAGRPQFEGILDAYASGLEGGKGRVDSVATQDAVLDAMRVMIHDSVMDKPMARMHALELDRAWKPGDPDSNRRSIMVTLDALAQDTVGGTVSVEQWVFDNGKGSLVRPAPAKITDQGDYIVVGGVIIPKRTTTRRIGRKGIAARSAGSPHRAARRVPRKKSGWGIREQRVRGVARELTAWRELRWVSPEFRVRGSRGGGRGAKG